MKNACLVVILRKQKRRPSARHVSIYGTKSLLGANKMGYK